MHAQTDRHRLSHTHASALAYTVHMTRSEFVLERDWTLEHSWDCVVGRDDSDSIRYDDDRSHRFVYACSLSSHCKRIHLRVGREFIGIAAKPFKIDMRSVWCGVACACAMHSVGTCTAANFCLSLILIKVILYLIDPAMASKAKHESHNRYC